MPAELSRGQGQLLRLRAQGLVGDEDSRSTVADIVHGCCGLQAQDARQVPLSIRARSQGRTAADVDRAWFEDQTIARTWCMRGTRHYVANDDLPWLIPLFGPLYVGRGQRRLTELGFNEDDAERAVEVIRGALADDGPLTRDEVADRLLKEGFEFDPDGQAPVQIVRRASLESVAIEAAPRDGAETYTLLEDRASLDSAFNQEDALAELARRYVAAYEPATPADLYTWSGLYKRDARAGWDIIEDELIEVDVGGRRAWTLSDPGAVEPGDTPIVRLLPMYDSYFLGHEDRDLILPDEYADRVYPGGGMIRATVLVDGQAAGTWRLDRSPKTPVVHIDPFESFDSTVEAGIEAEAADVGRFFDTDVEFEIET